jgi:hypothetical protein
MSIELTARARGARSSQEDLVAELTLLPQTLAFNTLLNEATGKASGLITDSREGLYKETSVQLPVCLQGGLVPAERFTLNFMKPAPHKGLFK